MGNRVAKFSPMLSNISTSERFRGAFAPIKDPSASNLQAGDPDFKTPQHICEAASQAMAQGFTHYCSGLGDKTLREAICASLERDLGVSKSPEQVLVTNGGAQALFLAAASFLGPGDEAIVFDPGYSLYAMDIQATGARNVAVPLSADFHLDPAALAKAITPRTRAIFLNSPNNPTSTVFSKEDMEFIAELARKHDLLVVSDEVYHQLLYDGRKHASILAAKNIADQAILINSFSKTYAMTGWRLGYLVANADLIRQILHLHRALIGSVNTMAQRAGIVALQGDQSCVRAMVEEFDSRRKMMVELVREIPGLTCQMPEGAFYLFCRYSKALPAEKMTQYLLEKGVAVRSGTEFGAKGEGHIRLTFAVSPQVIRDGIRKIRKAFEELD